ncbi:hypothetical protein ACKXF4_00285 [Faecalibacterium prausnitzii]|uniref:hypothetical protein n=1 Tax=Faecalibacterium prausnitzii TaxID=853 RepID=UPI003AAE389B
MDFYGTIEPGLRTSPGDLAAHGGSRHDRHPHESFHGPLAAHTDWLAMIRAAGIRQLLIDLQGPELRIGTLRQSPCLLRSEGSSVRLGAQTAYLARQLWYRRLRPDSSFCWTTASFAGAGHTGIAGSPCVHRGARRHPAEPQKHCCTGPCGALAYP